MEGWKTNWKYEVDKESEMLYTEHMYKVSGSDFLKRSIILFPCFYNVDAIQRIREKYDPLANCIAPHITVVFPFESDLTTDVLESHISDALNGVKKFCVHLKGITGDFRDGYLFLNVKKGNDQIIALHDKLYGGILQKYLYKKATYCPHLTVGKLNDAAEFDKAILELGSSVESFETMIDKVYVENIDGNGNSVIECSLDLE